MKIDKKIVSCSELKVYMEKPDEIMERLPEIEDKLVAAWNALSDDAVK